MWRAAGLALLAGTLLVPLAAARADDRGVVTASVSVAGHVSIELLVPDRKIHAGNPFQVEARLIATPGTSGAIELHYPETILLRDGPSQEVPLKPGQTTVVRWSACSATPGMHVIMASFEGAAGVTVDSPAAVVQVTGKKNESCPDPWQ